MSFHNTALSLCNWINLKIIWDSGITFDSEQAIPSCQKVRKGDSKQVSENVKRETEKQWKSYYNELNLSILNFQSGPL